jgi:hypothetical protein
MVPLTGGNELPNAGFGDTVDVSVTDAPRVIGPSGEGVVTVCVGAGATVKHSAELLSDEER